MKRSSSQAPLAVLLLTVAPAIAQPANDCSDPYWQDSLRCLSSPGTLPQPVPDPPSNPAQIKEYTRFPLLSNFGIRCADGTRPVLYIDPAVSGPSNDWLISFTGGASCRAEDSDLDGTYDDGQLCVDFYFGGEAGAMGTSSDPAMKHLGNIPAASEGVLKPNITVNPVFAEYNRVRVEKCGFDRHNGRVTHPDLAALDPGNNPLDYSLYQHGRLIGHLALDELRGDFGTGLGISYTTWVEQGGKVVEQTETLPALEHADTVVLVGHSAGAHGLLHNTDAFADHLRAWLGFAGDVRTVIDANFLPAVENEVSFDPGQSGDLYDHVFSGTTNDTGNYDGELYWNGEYAREYEAWMADPADPLETLFDASCVAAHQAANEEWMCRDRHHVLFNHLTTPFFIREDLSDPSGPHTMGGLGHVANWGEIASYPHCGILGMDPCPPLIPVGNPSPYRDRLHQQAQTVAGDLATRSELALGADTSGPPPSHFYWMPNCGSHNGAYQDAPFYTQEFIGSAPVATFRELLEVFVAAPPTGAVATLIDGIDGTSACLGSLFVDGFESGDTTAWSTTVE